ncbi:Type IV secretory pathway, VirD2 component [Nitrospirillum viridazoti Y2]|uniref:Type IV secretory pathway VirD2 relaxase n=1 Tax=Nitrospirillum amazonense TaxID=28077 RepID=A0A560HJG3_9PROT|nr:DUF3363 domain-containing protein [Nitrospirillum amazonense]EGY00086.1 Type IV secretory pathway, VirD2 component [Nitrospirillum amazonense Y2]TWB46633.1 type IV secretory pathway VirD2 relaxase [Nitrospirillum amazonense]
MRRRGEWDADAFLRPRLGRFRAERQPRLFKAKVLVARDQAGVVSTRSKRSMAGRGAGVAWKLGRGLLAQRGRRVVVKARIVRHGRRGAPLGTHLAYLRREGVTKDGQPARMFSADTDDADVRAFVSRTAEDRHHFRFIVSPEDAADLTDLRAYTRDLVRTMGRDLGTRLEWVAVDHWNTDNPHVHLIVRGKDEAGRDLVIHRNYITQGLRARAQELATLELGPRSEWEIQTKLAREMEAERWTQLDRTLARVATTEPTGVIDMRSASDCGDGAGVQILLIGRLQRLQTLGLASTDGEGRWRLAEDAEPTLKAMGRRGDIIRTMNQTLGRAAADVTIHDDQGPVRAIQGRVLAKGLEDELSGRAFLAVQDEQGQAHYIRLRLAFDIDAVCVGDLVRVVADRSNSSIGIQLVPARGISVS